MATNKPKHLRRAYRNGATKLMKVPPEYEKNFLNKLDKRTQAAVELRGAFTELASDLGGREDMSHVKTALAERFVFLEYTLRQIEVAIAESGPMDSLDLVGKWGQAVNALSGLATRLGMQRVRKTKAVDLKSYITDRKTDTPGA